METNAVLKDLVYTFLTNATAEVNKVARIARKLKLKERFSAKLLHVGIAHPFLSQGFIARIEKLFQYQATDHQTEGDCMFTLLGYKRFLANCPQASTPAISPTPTIPKN